METNEDIRSYNVGNSNYSKHKIQPRYESEETSGELEKLKKEVRYDKNSGQFYWIKFIEI